MAWWISFDKETFIFISLSFSCKSFRFTVQLDWARFRWAEGWIQFCIWCEELLKQEDGMLMLANIMVSWPACGSTLWSWQGNVESSSSMSRWVMPGPGCKSQGSQGDQGIKPLPEDRDGPRLEQGLAGPHSLGVPMVRPDRDVGTWRGAPLWHHWGRDCWPLGPDSGSWAMARLGELQALGKNSSGQFWL